MEDQILFHKSK